MCMSMYFDADVDGMQIRWLFFKVVCMYPCMSVFVCVCMDLCTFALRVEGWMGLATTLSVINPMFMCAYFKTVCA